MFEYPLVVIGAGAGGLVVAIGGSKAGKKVLLVERGTYGGDCTNFGCVPSKSLIASSHTAHSIKESGRLGIEASCSNLTSQKALERTRQIVAEIRGHEEPEALAKHGVDTLTGTAQFTDPHTLEVTTPEGEKVQVKGKQFVICTGSYPFVPPIEGIDTVPYLTNETIFDLKEVPEHLIAVGGGPIGCEMAQTFCRLGSKVTLIHSHHHLLPRNELESRKVIEETFKNEGIALHLGCRPAKLVKNGDKIDVTIRNKETGEESTASGTHLLISSGRRANLEALNLDAAGVKCHKKGITVDRYGRTSQSHIWAAGDITGEAPFTHMAENAARRILYNLLVPWPFKKKAPTLPIVPHVTYTDPEVAGIGMTEEEARGHYGDSKIVSYTVPLTEVDRAITTGRTEGFVKVTTKKWSSQIVGATIVAPRAGEMLLEVATAMHNRIPLRKLADVIHPYPTYSQGVRKAADQWLTKTILPSLKKLLGK